ncbi:thioesterase family protein [Herbaspirillum sp. RV1423]|uniref:acyl-CoA thioesterase n=1 Tax=Herbaspirillum sp. RV1423 TaxID=1443993 RepID=UPI0004B5D69E|nr:thioesterase family protein [Herbaspirillum sp. RV1423]
MTDKILIHTSCMKIRWGDMDAFGHVNNTVYFRYMEQTRIEWIEAAAVDMVAEGLGPVIVNAHCSFLRQLKYPADIEIRMYAKQPGRSSVETTYEIRRVDQPEIIYAEGGAKIVWVNFQQEKSVPLPDSIRRTLTGL